MIPGRYRSIKIRIDSFSVLLQVGHDAGITAIIMFSQLCVPAGRPEVFFFSIIFS